MVDLVTVLTIGRAELVRARRNRWFVICAALFAGLALSLSLLGLAGLGTIGIAGFGRTSAGLINLAAMIVPLMGLLMGALAIAGEREQGTLLTLLAQPVTTTEVLLGKFAGLAAALSGALLCGFGLSGIVIARYGGLAQLGGYLVLIAFAFLLALIFLGLGLWLSVGLPRASVAISVALISWLAVVIFSDLGVMGLAVFLRLAPAQLLALVLLNPLQVFKLAAMQMLQGNLELLGPVGVYAAEVFGRWLAPLLAGMLLVWVSAPLAAAAWWFHHRGGA